MSIHQLRCMDLQTVDMCPILGATAGGTFGGSLKRSKATESIPFYSLGKKGLTHRCLGCLSPTL